MNNLDKQYQTLLSTILEHGIVKEDRTGTGTKSIFGYTIRHNMQEGFPLLTTKRVYWNGIKTELLWFLQGDTNIKYLVENNCNIWNGDAYKKYCQIAGKLEEPDYDVHVEDINENRVRLLTQDEFVDRIKSDSKFAKQWGDLGPVYGKQWRGWKSEDEYHDGESYAYYQPIDQIKELIEQIKTNPNSRRLMVNAWNVSDLDKMTLPPCHYGFQCYVNDGKLSLMWNQRSVDTFLGLPFNIASYGLLLEMLAKETGLIADQLIGNLGDMYLYLDHLEQAKEQIEREPKPLPIMKLSSGHNLRAALKNRPNEIDLDDFMLVGYDPHPTIKAPLSN
jgi:thymidylate synthase